MPYDESGQYYPSRGIDGRMILGGIIALIGITLYMSQTQVNPVTGKKQHIAMSVDQEKSLGLQAAPKMSAEMGGSIDPETDRRAALVAEVGRRIVNKSDAARSPYMDNFHFHLLRDPKTVNAFALPGGQVFITLGLLTKLSDESEIAGVLGHEVGHVVNRHAAEHMAKGQLGQLLSVAVGVGASGGDDGGRTASMVASMVNQMSQLKFSRDDESEADMLGMKYMAQAGYNPTAMLDVMKVLKEASAGGRTPEMLATHPLPETRIEAIRSILKEDYPNGVPKALSRGRKLNWQPASER